MSKNSKIKVFKVSQDIKSLFQNLNQCEQYFFRYSDSPLAVEARKVYAKMIRLKTLDLANEMKAILEKFKSSDEVKSFSTKAMTGKIFEGTV